MRSTDEAKTCQSKNFQIFFPDNFISDFVSQEYEVFCDFVIKFCFNGALIDISEVATLFLFNFIVIMAKETSELTFSYTLCRRNNLNGG